MQFIIMREGMGTSEDRGVAGVGTMGAHMAMATVTQPAAAILMSSRKDMGTGDGEGTEAGARAVGVVAGARGGVVGVAEEEQEMSTHTQQRVELGLRQQQPPKVALLRHHPLLKEQRMQPKQVLLSR